MLEGKHEIPHHDVPPDLAAALEPYPGGQAAFEGVSYSQQQRFVLPIDAAKKPETRQRRVDKAVGMLRGGREG